MPDLAELTLVISSQQAQQATSALGNLTTAASSAEKQVDKLATAGDKAEASAKAVAAASDKTAAAVRAEAQGSQTAASASQQLGQAHQRLGQQTSRTAEATERLREAEGRLASSTRQVDTAGQSLAATNNRLGVATGRSAEETRRAGNEMRVATTATQQLEGAGQHLMGTYTRLAGILAQLGIAFSVAATLKSSLAASASFETTQIGLESLLGSAEAATKAIEGLKAAAVETPFEFKGLLESSKLMLAMGFEAEKLIPTMRTLADATAALGGNQQLFDRLTLALGQMQAKGKVSAEEMRQLAEAGLPAWRILAEAIGVDIPEAMKMAEAGVLDGAAAVDALLAGLNDRFGGMSARLMASLQGQFSNFKDSLGFALKDIGDALVEALDLKGVLASSQGALADYKETVADLIRIIGGLEPQFDSTGAAVESLGRAIRILIQLSAALILIKLAVWLGGIYTAVGGLNGALMLLEKHLNAIRYLIAQHPYVIAAAALAALAVAVYNFAKETQNASSELNTFHKALEELPQANQRLIDALNAVRAARITGNKMEELQKLRQELAALEEVLQKYRTLITGPEAISEIKIADIEKEFAFFTGREVSRTRTDVGEVPEFISRFQLQRQEFGGALPTREEQGLAAKDVRVFVDAQQFVNRLGLAYEDLKKKVDDFTQSMEQQGDGTRTLARESEALKNSIRALQQAEEEAKLKLTTPSDDLEETFRRLELTRKVYQQLEEQGKIAGMGEVTEEQRKQVDALVESILKYERAARLKIAADKAQSDAGDRAFQAAQQSQQALNKLVQSQLDENEALAKGAEAYAEYQDRVRAVAAAQGMLASSNGGMIRQALDLIDKYVKAAAAARALKAAEDQREADQLEAARNAEDARRAGSEIETILSALSLERELLGATNDERERAETLTKLNSLAMKAFGGDLAAVNVVMEEASRRLQQLEDRRVALAVEDTLKSLEDELRLVGLTADERERELLALQMKALLMNASEEAQKNLNQLVEQSEERLKELQALRKIKEAADAIGDAFGRAIEDFITGAGKASDVVKALALDIQRILIQSLVTKPLAEGISSILFKVATGGAAPSATPNALGNVFGPAGMLADFKSTSVAGAGVAAFAAGGLFGDVVSQPTLFHFGPDSRLGKMGEAGPEAIMPLGRAADGSLGVRMVGQGGRTSAPDGQAGAGQQAVNHYNVNINVSTPDVGGFRRSESQIVSSIKGRLR